MAAAVVLAALASSSCYRYVPVRLETADQHEDVRIRVTEPVASRLIKDLGAYTTELDGQVTRDGSDSIAIALAIGREYRGLALDSATQILHLSRADLVDVRRRTLSRSRTALASAGVLIAFGLFVGSVVQWGDPNTASQEPPPPPPSPIRFLLRVPIR